MDHHTVPHTVRGGQLVICIYDWTYRTPQHTQTQTCQMKITRNAHPVSSSLFVVSLLLSALFVSVLLFLVSLLLSMSLCFSSRLFSSIFASSRLFSSDLPRPRVVCQRGYHIAQRAERLVDRTSFFEPITRGLRAVVPLRPGQVNQ